MKTSDWEICVDTAANVPVEMMASRLGMDLVRCGSGLRHREFDSLKISGNLWKRWSGKTGILGKYVQGTTIQLVQEYAGLSFREAVQSILETADPRLADSMNRGSSRTSLKERAENAKSRQPQVWPGPRPEMLMPAPDPAPAVPLVLPPKSRFSENVFRYLTAERAIEPQVVVRELRAGRLYQDTRKNCVFLGRDENGEAAFASVRSTSPGNAFRMDCRGSRKAYSWRAVPDKGSDCVLAFESPIEAMSYMSIVSRNGKDWERSAYISLGGTAGAALFNYLETHPQTKNIYLCLNNDEAGRRGAAELREKIGTRAKILLPAQDGKDWNDVLREHAVTLANAAPGRRTAALIR